MKQETYEKVAARAGGRCEAEVYTTAGWTRCWNPAEELHHMLPKSRGGRILDDYGEIYHLIYLCKSDHIQAHSRKDADGLMIDGSVVWDKMKNRPWYQGTDPHLTATYPKRPTATDG